MATNALAKPAEVAKKKRHRSPNYPAVGLKEAVERTKKFIAEDGRAGAPAAIAAKHIGFATAHGQAYSVLSAMKKFGLIEEKDGRVVPTQRAVEINSLPEADERRRRAIGAAATTPPLYLELIEQHRTTGLPSDDTLAGELQAYKGFNPNGVREFLKGFKETLEFAGLTDLSVLGSTEKADESKEKPKVGDWVQWEHNGILGLPQAKKLVRLSEDGQFGFVEGSSTGLPVAEIIPAEPPEFSGRVPIRTLARVETRKNAQGVTMRQEVFSLTEGEVVLNWPSPLSPTSIQDLEDWLELVKRKISRSIPVVSVEDDEANNQPAQT